MSDIRSDYRKLEKIIEDRGHAFQEAQNKSLLKIADLEEKLRLAEEALVHLKHNNHHTIEEEMWKIDAALLKLRGE